MMGGKAQGNLPGSECGGVCRVNLRWSLQVDAWNGLTRREDNHMFLLSSELQCLNTSIAALSEFRRPDGGEIMVGGCTYFWSGRSDG